MKKSTKNTKRSIKRKKSPPPKIKKSIIKTVKPKKSPVKRGKDGTVEIIGQNRVRKTFRKNKNRDEIKNEIDLMKKGHRLGISPKVYDYEINIDNPYIVMEELGQTLCDCINKNNGEMSLSHQRQVIAILETLDQNLIFHGDVSPLNFMTGKGTNKNKLYIIDYGMAKKMDKAFVTEHSKNANIKLGITVFILKIREQFQGFHPVLLLEKVYSKLNL